jgi:hypothetical protein
MINYTIQLNNAEFKNTIDTILSQSKIDEIIETGTYHGDGSTKIFANTDKYVFTIECNYQNWIISSNNLINNPNVCVIHGLSLNREELIKGLLNENFDINTTYDSNYPKTFYMREISQQVTVENALDIFVDNNRYQLVFLDSAGGIGYLEFKKFMSYNKSYLKNKVLILDDISHIKHIRSVEFLKLTGFDFNISSDKRFAWCSFQEQKNQNILFQLQHPPKKTSI